MSDVDIDEELFALAGGGDDDVEEGEASSASAPSSPADSLGSDAMEESDSDDGGDDEPQARSGDVPYPLEGKYVNADDKARIQAMSLLEREKVLGERAEEMNRLQWKSELARRAAQETSGAAGDRKRKASSLEPDDAMRKSSRQKVKTKTNEKLDTYKRDRERRQEQKERNQDRRNRRRSSSIDDRRSDMDADGDDEVDYPEYDHVPRQEEPADLRDFQSVTVGRSFFADVCFNPGFDAAIPGAFVRVGVGNDPSRRVTLYKMAQIKGFATGKPYVFEGKNGRVATDQYATVQYGTTKKDYNFSHMSNGPLTESDLNSYKQSLAETGAKIPTKSVLQSKYDDIKCFMEHTWTDPEINDRLAKRAKYKHLLVSSRTANSAPRIPTPAELEAQRIAELNAKNRRQDSERVRKALIEERRQNIMQRKQREKEYHQKKALEEAKKKADEEAKSSMDDLFDGDSKAATPRVATPKPAGDKKKEPKGVPTFRKPVMEDDIIASLDLGMEIEI